MTTETILTDDMSLIEQLRGYAANNGYSHNDYADTMTAAADALERHEQAVLQSLPVQTSSAIRGDSYAGVYIWFGSDNILQHIPKLLAENANDPQDMLDVVASECIKKLERHNVLQSPEIQALREDAGRLDWLVEQRAYISEGGKSLPDGFAHGYWLTWPDDDITQPGVFASPREAVSAAMEQPCLNSHNL